MALNELKKRVDYTDPGTERAKHKENMKTPLKMASKPFEGLNVIRNQKGAKKKNKVVNKSVRRTDVIAKVTGRARYTDDFDMPGMLFAKYFRSTIAHGKVTHISITKAKAVPGVEAVFTYKDVPQIYYSTAGHPHHLDPEQREVADRLLLSQYVRFWGDAIAIVVGKDEITINKALELIEVEYDTYEPLIELDQILAENAREIHKGSKNTIAEHSLLSPFKDESDNELAFSDADIILDGDYRTSMVQHCHIENHTAYAYMEDTTHITIVTSTAIPHILRQQLWMKSSGVKHFFIFVL